MKINEFKLERYFAQHEFSAKYLLSSSDCDGFGMKEVLDTASKEDRLLWDELSLGYTESQGHPLLREAICAFYKKANKENVLIASPGELNFITMNVLLDPKDHVISVSPSYQSLTEVVKAIGCEISYWKPNPENWYFDPLELEKLLKKNTKLLIINFPHNPTGAYLSQADLDKIIAIARKHQLYLFSDEMYHKLTIGTMEELLPVCDLYEKGISLWGTSKSFGLAGLRTGWIVTQDKRLLNKILAFKDYLSICSSAPSELITLMALHNYERFLSINIEKIKRNIVLFSDFVTKHPSLLSFIPPQAGSTAFVKVNSKVSSLEFCNTLIEETGIMAVPGEMFGYKGKYIRIGFGRENFVEILNELDRFLSNYKT